jgi:hypothetical protein
VSRYAYEAEPDHVVSFQDGCVALQWRMRGGKFFVLEKSATRVTSNRIVLDASGLPVFVAGVNYGDDTDGTRMTAALRTAWPTARAVFVDARCSWQGSDVAYFDVVLDDG